jgi:hypothetical protein
MKRSVFSAALALAALLFAFPAGADEERLVRFDGRIGVIPVSNGVVPAGLPATTPTAEVVTRNVVRGTPPGGQPWVIDRLRADVDRDGGISVRGDGLLLAGGNNIGTAAGQSVRARLFCQVPNSNPATFAAHDTGLVPLEANGDFRIDDVVSPAPPVPCDNPVLLIVSAGGNWFAAGIQKR